MMETDRIILRPWREEDAGTLFKWASDPELGPLAGWPPHKSVDESREIIRSIFSAEGMWAVVLKETGEPIGCAGYLPSSSSNLQIADDEGEVGYWIASNPASGRVMQKCGFTDTGREVLCPSLEVGSDKPVKVMRLER